MHSLLPQWISIIECCGGKNWNIKDNFSSQRFDDVEENEEVNGFRRQELDENGKCIRKINDKKTKSNIQIKEKALMVSRNSTLK